MIRQNFFKLILILLAIFPAIAISEEPARGKLPDGRAYRTDENGNQLVDYIAELEVNVDSLERRVYGLEDQLKEKTDTIRRLQGGGAAEASLKERDLAPNTKARGEEPVVIDPAQSAEIDALQSKLAALRVELAKEQELHRKDIAFYQDAMTKSSGTAKDCSTELQAINLKINEKNQALSQSRQRISELETQLSDAQKVSQRVERQPSEAVAMLRDTEIAHKPNARDEFKTSDTSRETPHLAKSVYRSTSGLPTVSASSSARTRAVDSAKVGMNSDLARLKMSVSNRDALFAKYDQRGKSVQFKPSKAVSSRNMTIGQVESELAGASSFRQLADLKQDIQEISKRVNDDITLIQRLSKKG